MCVCVHVRVCLFGGHGVLKAPDLEQSHLEALWAQRGVVEGGAAARAAVVQLRVDVERVALAPSWTDSSTTRTSAKQQH